MASNPTATDGQMVLMVAKSTYMSQAAACSALRFARPMGYYRGDPERLLEERKGKPAKATVSRGQPANQAANALLRGRTMEVKQSLISEPICATC